MKYRTIGSDPGTRREVSVLALGAMLFGSRADEETSFAVLDRFVEAGGNFIDTSDNYAFWIDGEQGYAFWIDGQQGGRVNQVVLAWQSGGRFPIVPLAGVSSVAQLEENLGAVELDLTEEQRLRLDAAH